MISILSKLVRPVARCVKYESRLGVPKTRDCYWRVATRNHTAASHERPMYRTRLAYPADYDRVMCFMYETYFKDDPTLVNIGLDDQEPPPSLRQFMYDCVREGMTIIAEDPNNEIIGAAVNNGTCPWDPDRLCNFARCCECGVIRDLLEFEVFLAKKPDLWQRYSVYKIFECSYIAVKRECRNQGIARKLILDSWYLARDCTYRLFRIDCNNRYLTKIAEGFGWKKVCTILFDQYVKHNEHVFKCIQEPHVDVQVYIDLVTKCKTYCPSDKKCTKITKVPKVSRTKS